METLTAMFEEYKYSHSKSLIILWSTMSIISVISSCCLIRMIMTSKDRLTTTYHRLMLGMSIGDILFSLPMTTFAAISPTDMSYMVWNARGNQATCTANGFFVVMGMYLTLYYSCGLNIYYLLLIKYNKSDSYIRTKIEPFLHGSPVLMALIVGTIGMVNKNYNDGGVGACTTAPTYNPPHCKGYKDGEVREGFMIPCGRGQGEEFYFINGIFAAIIPPVVIGISLGMLYRHVSNQEKIMSRYGIGALTSSSEQSSSDQSRDRSYSRAVLDRALAYSCSYFLTWGWFIGGAIMQLLGVEIPIPYNYLWAIFGALEGFFNLLIFMHPKVVAVKKSHHGADNIPWPQAYAKIFWSDLVGGESKKNDYERNRRTPAAYYNNNMAKNAPDDNGDNDKTSVTHPGTSNQ